METLSKKIVDKKTAPIKIMQFGEGNFLRAFIDWMIKKMNDSKQYQGHVVIVQPLPNGRVKEIMDQDGLYTLILQGLIDGKAQRIHSVIDVIDAAVNPYNDYQSFLEYGRSPILEVIVSNTTEAGIVFEPKDVNVDLDKDCPLSFPGKLLGLLKARYLSLHDEKPLAIIPCELIDDNGDKLKEVLLELCNARKEAQGFIDYVKNVTHYTSTLVDRIVPGFPRDEFEKLCAEYGYVDNNMVKGECFDLFVLKNDPYIEEVFPVHKFDLEAYYVDDIHPYKKRKVRVLNGSHTALVPVAFLSGFDEVGESLKDPLIDRFLQGLVFDEIVPTIEVEGIKKFADSVFLRFANPFVHHALLSIALNSIPKFKERNLGTLLDNIRDGKKPKHLLFALAALINFYRGSRIVNEKEEVIPLKDGPEVISFMADTFANIHDSSSIVKNILANVSFWGQDLSKESTILHEVTRYYELQLELGVYKALEWMINE